MGDLDTYIDLQRALCWGE